VVFKNSYVFVPRLLAKPLTMFCWTLVESHRSNLSWSSNKSTN